MTRDSSPLHEQTSLQLLALAIQEQETNVGELSNLYKEAAKSSQSGNQISDELRKKLNDVRESVVNGENSIENELKIIASRNKANDMEESLEKQELVKNISVMEKTLLQVKKKREESEALLQNYNSAIGKAADSLRLTQSYGARMSALLFLAIAMFALTVMIIFHDKYTIYGLIIVIGCGIVSLYHSVRYLIKKWA